MFLNCQCLYTWQPEADLTTCGMMLGTVSGAQGATYTITRNEEGYDTCSSVLMPVGD